MAEYTDREHFIPVRKNELVDLLCTDSDLTNDERELFRRFCKLVTATYHFEFNQRLEQLKADYGPFDPDAETPSLVKLSSDEKQHRLDELFQDFAWLLERANFKQLSRAEIETASAGNSNWGLRTDVDFDVFERIAVFARGDAVQTRSRRRLGKLYRVEEVKVPIYRRLVLIVKLRPHRRLGNSVDTKSVYMKVFKDIAKQDVDMLLPGARFHFSSFDRGKIGLPFLSGLALALGNVVRHITDDVLGAFTTTFLGSGGSPTLWLWGIASGALGYGTKSYFAYQGTKHRYHLTLTESLYYLNLDSNAGVLFHLLDEAEEQECREAILAYYCLWRRAGQRGWTSPELDDFIEEYLERRAGQKIDFEIGDGIDKLERLRIVEKLGDRYRARPMKLALEMLDRTWDNCFTYNNPEFEQAPIWAE